MGSRHILPVKVTITMDTMLKFLGDFLMGCVFVGICEQSLTRTI